MWFHRVVIRALIFDCDGTLADNEPLHFRAMAEALLAERLVLSPADYRGVVGLPDGPAFRSILEARGATPTPEAVAALVAAKKEAYRKSLLAGVTPVPGVADFVRGARETLLLAVASGSWREEVHRVLDSLGLRDQFRAVVTAEDFRAGKPDPEPFLAALAALNASSPAPGPPVAAGECLVFEDSPHGVAAAAAAGMRCVGITTTHNGDGLRDADLVAPNYRSLDLRRVTAFFDRRAR